MSPKKILVGGWATHLKNMSVKLDHFSNFRDENKKICETTIPKMVYLPIFTNKITQM